MTIIPYKSCLIAVYEQGGRVDIIDPSTGKWMAASSVRNVKWTITVWERLNREFSAPNVQQRWDYLGATKRQTPQQPTTH